MISQTFDAIIVNGQPLPTESFEPYEGQRVHITISPPADAMELTLEIDVEKDVSARIPFARQVVKGLVIGEPTEFRPCLIIPEDIRDE